MNGNDLQLHRWSINILSHLLTLIVCLLWITHWRIPRVVFLRH